MQKVFLFQNLVVPLPYQNDTTMKNTAKKYSKSFDIQTAFNPKYNFIVVLIKKNREVCYMHKSASYENCYKQLLFWQQNYAYPQEVQEFTIDQLIF